MRLGLSANTLSPAPYVHFSFPGRVLTSFGQFLTTSYPPVRSSPPTGPGTAANPVPGFACPSTGDSLPEILRPTVTPIANIKTIKLIFFMRILRTILSDGFSGAGFSLWGLALRCSKTHRLKPAPLNPHETATALIDCKAV